MIAFVLPALVLCNLAASASSTQSRSGAKIDYIAKLNELVRRGSDESLNAEPFYRKAFSLYVKPSIEVSVDEIACWPMRLTDEQRSILKQWVGANSEALAQLQAGTARPRYWFQYQGLSTLEINQVEHIRIMRDLFFALVLRAKLKAAEGNATGAIEDLLICYRFNSDMKTRPLLREQEAARASLVYTWRAGFQILDRARVDDVSLRILQEQIATRSGDGDFLVDLSGDEVASLDRIRWMYGRWPRTTRLARLKEEILWKASDFWGTYIPPDQIDSFLCNHTQEELERLVEKAYPYYRTILSKTPFQWHEEEIDWYKTKMDSIDKNLLLFMLMPNIPLTSEIGFRCRVERDALITTLALLRYRNDTGGLPDDLRALITGGYVCQLPMDPYSDKALVYKRTENNFILYSIGADFRDNDGRHSGKWGLEAQGGDFVFWPVHSE